jgi:hypothetical protein
MQNMDNITAKATGNRGQFTRKQAGNETPSAQQRFSPKRPISHHGLLRGPYYPLIDNPRQRQP